jgi:hypothetical protein
MVSYRTKLSSLGWKVSHEVKLWYEVIWIQFSELRAMIHDKIVELVNCIYTVIFWRENYLTDLYECTQALPEWLIFLSIG